MRFGVNYLPRENWWYEWGEDDGGAFERDLDRIAALGFDHLRVQCLWPVFQPNPSWVSPRALRRLIRLLDAAEQRRLAVCVTILDGWLSGFDLRPDWLPAVGRFTDPAAVDAAALLVGEVARAVAGHPALWCIDIANEPNVLMGDLGPGEGEPWATRMLDAARAVSGPASVPVTIGVDHAPWMSDAAPIGRGFLVGSCDIVAIHAWPFFTGALDAVGEERAWAIPDYLAQVARSTPGATGKPLWIQELGVSEQWLAATHPDDFAESMLRRSAAVPGVEAVTWWASHDIDRRFAGFAELEYGLGLIDAEGRLKSIGRRVTDVIAELRQRPEAPARAHSTAPLELAAGAEPGIAFARTWFENLDPRFGPEIAVAGGAR